MSNVKKVLENLSKEDKLEEGLLSSMEIDRLNQYIEPIFDDLENVQENVDKLITEIEEVFKDKDLDNNKNRQVESVRKDLLDAEKEISYRLENIDDIVDVLRNIQ